MLEKRKFESIADDFTLLQNSAPQLLTGLDYFLYDGWPIWKKVGEARFSNEVDLVETFLDGVMILKRLWENGLRLSNMVNKYPISAFIEYVLNQQNDQVIQQNDQVTLLPGEFNPL